MNAPHTFAPALKPALLFIALASLPLGPQAGPGHDHGHDQGHDHGNAAPATALLKPRFVAQSELFELVGELNGKTLTLYLDRADTNEPVLAASLELELAGTRLQAQAQPDGRFLAELTSVPAAALLPVTATISAGDDSDLLAAELDLRASADADPAHRPWLERLAGGAAGLGLLAVGAWALLRRSRRQPGGLA